MGEITQDDEVRFINDYAYTYGIRKKCPQHLMKKGKTLEAG